MGNHSACQFSSLSYVYEKNISDWFLGSNCLLLYGMLIRSVRGDITLGLSFRCGNLCSRSLRLMSHIDLDHLCKPANRDRLIFVIKC